MIEKLVTPDFNKAWIRLIEVNREKLMIAGRETYKTALVAEYKGTGYMQPPTVCIDSAGNLKSDVEHWKEFKSNQNARNCIKVFDFKFYVESVKLSADALDIYLEECIDSWIDWIKNHGKMGFCDGIAI